jgi:hypothetical protein
MADNLRNQGRAAQKQKLEKELATLQSRYGKAIKLIEEEGDGNTSHTKGANTILSKIDEVKQQLKDMRGSVPVKKAYGGMVKKKQGGSANKVNMKAGFTRRGCSKG